MNKKTLLQQAKEIKFSPRTRSKIPSDEEMDLYVAWLKDEVTSKQVIKVLNSKYPANMLSRASNVLKFAYKAGKIK